MSTDAVHAEVAEWQMRLLERAYPVVFLDALICKVRDGGSMKNKAALTRSQAAGVLSPSHFSSRCVRPS